MKITRYLLLPILISVFFGTLPGCSHLKNRSHLVASVIAEQPQLLSVFAPDWELSATLQLSPLEGDGLPGTSIEHYILAMSTRGQKRQLSVLTAQGVPLFNISSTEPTIQRLTRMDYSLDPTILLTYLYLMYAEHKMLDAQLQQRGYSLQQVPNGRTIQTEAQLVMNIHYVGAAPWRQRLTLEDRQSQSLLTLTILDASHVSFE